MGSLQVCVVPVLGGHPRLTAIVGTVPNNFKFNNSLDACIMTVLVTGQHESGSSSLTTQERDLSKSLSKALMHVASVSS